MSPTDCLGVPWLALTARVEAARTLARWAHREPALLPFGCLDDIAHALHHDRDPDQADAVLGALLRLGARDGGDDTDAALLVAHLLHPGTRRLALDLRDLSDDIDDVIGSTVWLQIRHFPWRKRTRAYAKNVLEDTRSAVLDDLLPYRVAGAADRVALVDPLPAQTDLAQAADELSEQAGYEPNPLHRPVWDAHDTADIHLDEVLEWARRTGVVSDSDVALLLDLVLVGDELNSARRGRTSGVAEMVEVAGRWEVGYRNVWRRRHQAISRLRAAHHRYLNAVA